jgi:hypothetical protein
VSELPDLARFRELRPDLFVPGGGIRAGAMYVVALKTLTDRGLPATEEALLDVVEESYPDPRKPRARGRPRVTGPVARRRFTDEVRKLRKAGKPADTDEDVAESMGMSARQIGRWRSRYGLPHAPEVPDE